MGCVPSHPANQLVVCRGRVPSRPDQSGKARIIGTDSIPPRELIRGKTLIQAGEGVSHRGHMNRGSPSLRLKFHIIYPMDGNVPQFPQRKPNRLVEYDYSQEGLYFVTICTENRKELLSKITIGVGSKPRVELSFIGKEVKNTIDYINQNYPGIKIENYVIMPNHVHILVEIEEIENKISLDDVIGRLKSFTTKRFNQLIRSKNSVLWQRSFYDHVIRDQDDCANVQEYIDLNPQLWLSDEYFS